MLTGISFITVSQVWGGKIADFDNGKLTSFPNRKSVGNLEIFIIKFASRDPTNPVIVEDWKPIIDGYANDLDNLGNCNKRDSC